MRMILAGALALGMLGGCATQQQQYRPTAGDDPSLPCYQALESDARLEHLRTKIGNTARSDRVTVEILASTERPTEIERREISIWAATRQECVQRGAAFRAQYAPPGWAAAYDEGAAASLALTAQLYAGEISYGQFAQRRQALGVQTGGRLRAAERENSANLRAEAAQRQAQAAASMQLYLQMMRPVTPLPAPPTSTNCRTTYAGNVANTTCF